MATRTISVLGGNYNSIATWVEGAIPTGDDAVVATALSGNLTITAAAQCLSADFTNYVGILNHGAFGWTIGDTGNGAIGNLKFVAGMTYTISASANCQIIFDSEEPGLTCEFTTAGKTMPNVFIKEVDTSVKLMDNLTCTNLSVQNSADFNCNNKNITATTLISFTGTNSVLMGSGTFTCNNIILNTGVNIGTSSIVMTGSGASITPNGISLYNLTISATTLTFAKSTTVSNNLIINGPCTLTWNTASANTLQFGASVVINSSAGNVVTITKSGAGAFGTTRGTGGTYNFDYLNITNNHATNGTFNSPTPNCVDGGGNTGWIFSSTSISKINNLAKASVSKVDNLAIASILKINNLS